MNPKKIIVTGGAGFIGSNFVRHTLSSHPDVKVVVIDSLTYAGNKHNLDGLDEDRLAFAQMDVCDEEGVQRLILEYHVDAIVHFAAETHVDRSIDGPGAFIRTNIQGTASMLQAARKAWGRTTEVRFHHVSTDEVYGSLGPDGAFVEETPYDPSSPYSASKAASDHLVRAWYRTFGLPVTITNCSNNYGPYQFPEKLIPLMIDKGLQGEPLPVYGDGRNVRDWLYVEDHCRAIDLVLREGKPGETYNVGGRTEKTNLELVRTLCSILDEKSPLPSGPHEKLIEFVKDRPGHDLRYAIDCSKIERELGWSSKEDLQEGLRKTVQWYLDNQGWVEDVRSGKYRGERMGVQ